MQDLDLLSPEGREERIHSLLSKCHKDQLHVHCEDDSLDLCPQGHLLYGLVTLGAMAFPGILLALSEFKHFKAFRFGLLFGRLYGQVKRII